MSFFAEHWEALASLLLAVVAIAIAIYSSRRTAKDATRQIESIKNLSQQTIENTTKEIESVKELAKMLIQTLSIELDMEISKYQVFATRADEEREKLKGIQDMYQRDFKIMMMQDYQNEQPMRDLKYHTMYIQQLREISKRLDQLKNQFELIL